MTTPPPQRAKQQIRQGWSANQTQARVRGPTRCRFEKDSLLQPETLLTKSGIAALDRSIHDFAERTKMEAQQSDLLARDIFSLVQEKATQLWPTASVSCFGSRACGMASATSDVDLVLLGVPHIDCASADGDIEAQLLLLDALAELLKGLPGVTSLRVNKARVPVIYLTMLPVDLPPGTVELSVDISLHTGQHTGLLAAHHVRCLYETLPMIQPLVFVLKELLRRQKLKSTFTGGLSSYAITLMVAHFLLDHPAEELSSRTPAMMLLSFLHFFGGVFDAQAHCMCSGLNGGGSANIGGFVKRSHRMLEPWASDPLLLCDPVLPMHNVAEGCYRIRAIQGVFNYAVVALLGAATCAETSVVTTPTSSSEPPATVPIDVDILEPMFALHCQGQCY